MNRDEPSEDTDSDASERPSKSLRKRQSTGLQDLGEALIGLPEAELAALALPDQLRDAVMLARRITAHGGLYRQKQYIGKLMRKIDAEPIRAALAAKRDSARREALQFRRTEQWRDQLIREGASGVERFLAEHPDRTDAATLRDLVERARIERQTGSAPHAGRELFRVLRIALGEDSSSATIRA